MFFEIPPRSPCIISQATDCQTFSFDLPLKALSIAIIVDYNFIISIVIHINCHQVHINCHQAFINFTSLPSKGRSFHIIAIKSGGGRDHCIARDFVRASLQCAHSNFLSASQTPQIYDSAQPPSPAVKSVFFSELYCLEQVAWVRKQRLLFILLFFFCLLLLVEACYIILLVNACL